MTQFRHIYIGYDAREDIAYQVCRHSISRSNSDIPITPLVQTDLRNRGIYTRAPDPLASTEFTFTRFLVPQLQNFSGWAVFMDCDIVATVDIGELFDLADDRYAVMCVKHDYKPKSTLKMDGQKQSLYPRKNWSSVILFNCGHPANSILTADYVNNEKMSGAHFHRFSWLEDELIGDLHHTWNYLVGWYSDLSSPNLLHYTEGGPWFENYRNCPFSSIWKEQLFDMLGS